jgi:hypothetical protein
MADKEEWQKSLDEKVKEVAKSSQPTKGKIPEPPVALKTCTVHLEDATVVLVEGQPIYGLTRQERNHLKVHKFIK